jgi:hypothetical protein
MNGGRVKNKRFAFFVLFFSFLACCVPLFAHHGASEYDMTKVISLQATVTDFQFVNPHTLIAFTAKDDTGKAAEWQGELPSPNLLVRRGWSKNVIKVGDQVTIIGNPAKNGEKGMQIKRLVFPDGRELPGTILPPDSSK